MPDLHAERMAAAREIAEKIVAVCAAYERAPSQTTINLFLQSVERLANLAEDIEVQQTLRALDG